MRLPVAAPYIDSALLSMTQTTQAPRRVLSERNSTHAPADVVVMHQGKIAAANDRGDCWRAVGRVFAFVALISGLAACGTSDGSAAVPTSTATVLPTKAVTATITPTPAPSPTETQTAAASSTPSPTATDTPVPVPSSTGTPTVTPTATLRPTASPSSTGTLSPTTTPTPTPTLTPTTTLADTLTPTATETPTPTATCTSTSTPTGTALPCVCNPPDQCHQEGTCNGDGSCTYLPVPDGTACSNGGTICVAGSCTQPPLASLTVSPLLLHPDFSPSISDYAVVCSPGTNTVTLEMSAVAGGTVALSAPANTPWAPSASISVSLTEDEAAVVLAQDATGFTQQYWIRCLPHDFPLVAPSPHPEIGSPTPGWYLIGNVFVATGSGFFAMIVDANGTPLWYHRTAAPPTTVAALPGSTVGVTTLAGPPAASVGTLYLLDTGTTQTVNTVGLPLNDHELFELPNGNFMLLSYPILTGVDLTGLSSYGANSTIFDCAVQEVDPQGNLLWDWRASDHTDPAKESAVPQGAGTDASPADVYHCNSIDVNADSDVLISIRHMNAVLLVAKSTGNVVWKLGGRPYNKDGAQLLAIRDDPEAAFYMQHDARFQPNGDISLFDDHSAAAGVTGPARGVEYALDLNAGVAHVVWQYQGPASSNALGSFRRYGDGSNLIGWGNSTGTANLAFTEVDAAGQNLIDMLFASKGNWSYRAEKVPIGTFDIDALRRTAGQP